MMNNKFFPTIAIMVALLATAACNNRKEEADLDDAGRLELLDLKIKKHPTDADLLAQRGILLTRLGRTSEAVFDLQRASSLQPSNIGFLVALADANLANGNADASYSTLSQALQLDPDHTEALLKMGELTFYRGDYDRSIKCLSQVTAKEPDNRTALFMKGFIYKATGDTASAVTLFRRVCDLYPDYEPAFEELGILYSLRANDLAVEYLSTALRLEPSNTNAMYALAMHHQNAGRMDEAEQLYRQILTLNPNSADAWHNLGWIELTHYADYPRAAAFFDSALAIDPSMPNALENKQLALDAMKH